MTGQVGRSAFPNHWEENSISEAKQDDHPTAGSTIVEQHRSEVTLEIPTPPKLAFLSVQLLFHEEQLEDIEVEFAKTGARNQPGDRIGEAQRTDINGIAKLESAVPVGNYLCQIEHQPPTVVSTVEDKNKPLVLRLPIGIPISIFEEKPKQC